MFRHLRLWISMLRTHNAQIQYQSSRQINQGASTLRSVLVCHRYTLQKFVPTEVHDTFFQTCNNTI